MPLTSRPSWRGREGRSHQERWQGKAQTEVSGGNQASPDWLSAAEMGICLPCVDTSKNAFSTSQESTEVTKKGCAWFQPCCDGGQVRVRNSWEKNTVPSSGTVTQISLSGTLPQPAPPALVSLRQLSGCSLIPALLGDALPEWGASRDTWAQRHLLPGIGWRRLWRMMSKSHESEKQIMGWKSLPVK